MSRAHTIFRVAATLVVATALAACSGRSDSTKGDAMTRTPPPGKNRLAFEKSPYLLQHADNPVDWYPWGDEAFATARREDKPIFLSIGYSTCHWCHVMEHESFEDDSVATLLNDAFVCVKVDREERPDIDNVYMTVCQMMTGRGGWPLTILMTPDKVPFFAATYIPRDALMGFIPRVKNAWRDDRDAILKDATHIREALAKSVAAARGDALGADMLDTAYHQLSARYDSTYGGFGTAPKFPSPHNLIFLLRTWNRTGDPHALAMVEKTLDRMRRGGMYDQVGFGFHRYSTDARWFVPHFEKMLYDQALPAMAYTEAFQATGKARYRRTAEEIFTYVARDMTDAQGGFRSAEDADSEGEEGKFYLWSEAQLRDVLGGDADLANRVFGVAAEGNYTPETGGHGTGENILYLEKPLPEQAAAMGVDEDTLRARVDDIRRRLLAARERRVRPGLDDKVLADWNGLMIAALARGGRVFGRDDLTERAAAAARFVLDHMRAPDGSLLHRYRDGDASIPGMIDDYAFMTWGLIDLYESTFDVAYLQNALDLVKIMNARFWDTAAGGYFFTAAGAESLIVRPKDVYDGALPSGNSVAALDLVRLARITADQDLERRAADIGRAFHDDVARAPGAFTMLMTAVDFMTGPSHEVVIAGRRGAPDVAAMRAALAARYAPRTVMVFRPSDGADAVVALAPYTREQTAIDGRATAYVCRDHACERPTTDIEQMLATLSTR